MNIKPFLKLFGIGFSMGSADIVPGVSGGTIAFIFGVYERLITAIKDVTNEVPKILLTGNIKKAWSLIPFSFVMPLGIGILSAILLLSHFLEEALHSYPVYVWSFFFGLVLASIFVVNKKIKKWTAKEIVAVIVGTILAYVVVGMVPVETPATPLLFFISGAIAICAMILPGISGSFLLIIMGKYEQILAAVTQKDFLTLGLVFIGAVVGLAVFSKLLNFLFSKYHDPLVAFLIGFMIGSLRKIWPWKEIVETRINSAGLEVPLIEANILPNWGLEIFGAVALAVIGMIFIIFISKVDTSQSE